MNGSTNNTPDFYAPTSAGTNGYYLKSNGSGAPSWESLVITLNGTATTSPGFYAPTGAGSNGQYLKSNGSGAPSWENFPTIPTIPVEDVQTSTDGTNYASVVTNKIAKIDLSSFLTASDISDMATQTWVGNQGFLTSTDISDMATQTWVGNQGFLTSVAWTDLTGTVPSLSDFTNDLIEANPSSGTPTQVLSTIQIGNVLYELSGGTTVVANPGGTATQTLTAIQIGSTIYSVSGGGGGGGMNNPMTAAGDIIYGGISGAPTALPKGTDGQFLSLASGVPSWVTFTGLIDPTTTQGDILIRGTNGIERLPIGSNGQVLTSNGTTASWQTPSGGGEPAAYIKSITKSGRTIT